MAKKSLGLGMAAMVLAFGLAVTGCGNDNGGGGEGVGSITITSLPAGFMNGRISHSGVTGTHSSLAAFTLVGGRVTSGILDDTGLSTIAGSSVTIPVRGISGGAAFGFTNGIYNVRFTITHADNAPFNRTYNVPVNFTGSGGTVAFDPNAAHWQSGGGGGGGGGTGGGGGGGTGATGPCGCTMPLCMQYQDCDDIGCTTSDNCHC